MDDKTPSRAASGPDNGGASTWSPVVLLPPAVAAGRLGPDVHTYCDLITMFRKKQNNNIHRVEGRSLSWRPPEGRVH